MTKYVLGFLFRNYKGETQVALIRKTRPEWQKGKLNGIGGHLEEDELPNDAMIREFKEEAGSVCNWKFFCTMVFDNDIAVYCFKSESIADIKTMTDEEVLWFPVKGLPDTVIPNLNWLIPMALQKEDGMNSIDLVMYYY